MKRFLLSLFLGLTLLNSAMTLAAERAVKLPVSGMYCISCPFSVQKSPSCVDGVLVVEAMLVDRTATVIFEDEITPLEVIKTDTT